MINAQIAALALGAFLGFGFGYLIGWSQCCSFKHLPSGRWTRTYRDDVEARARLAADAAWDDVPPPSMRRHP
jgi:hypothetical protein